MGAIDEFVPEKLIIGVLSSLPDRFCTVQPILEDEFGTIDYISEEIPFSFTRYYDQEMGTPIFRRFYAFKQPVTPDSLSAVKRRSNDLESKWAVGDKRRVNLDPGLLSLGRLVLASTKGPGHRIALADGIYAEVTLYYRAKRFQTLPWTYPDFRSDEYGAILREIREIYQNQLTDMGIASGL